MERSAETVWVGGQEVTAGCTSGKGWSYDVTSKTLTLGGFHYTGEGYQLPDGGAAIWSSGDLKLRLLGSNHVEHTGGMDDLVLTTEQPGCSIGFCAKGSDRPRFYSTYIQEGLHRFFTAAASVIGCVFVQDLRSFHGLFAKAGLRCCNKSGMEGTDLQSIVLFL